MYMEKYINRFCEHPYDTTEQPLTSYLKMHINTIAALFTTFFLSSFTTAVALLPRNTSSPPLRIGILFENVQMSDLSGLDVLGAQTPEIMDITVQMNPSLAPLRSLATPMEFHYISSSRDLAWITPKMWVRPDYTYTDAPRNWDVLLLGGPDPAAVAEESLRFLREASRKTRFVMTTCSGAMWLAKSGVLDGKRATTNRMVIESLAKKEWPQVEWLDQRWVVEEGLFEGAQIWTAGGAGCGKSFGPFFSAALVFCFFFFVLHLLFKIFFFFCFLLPRIEEVGLQGG